MVKESLSLKLRGSPSLKVLVARCSLSPPILRYGSQYLFEYDQGVSLLLMAIDKSASIGCGSRLQVTNLAPKASMSLRKL